MFNTKYKDDTSAIVDGCDCYACSHFTKGYIHHLFNCHELLGVHISGLHLGESPKQREFLLSTIYSKIPEDLVRFVTGPNTPSDILESIRCGTDVMVCSFPVLLAEKAYAS